jgi:hypothetical protein
VSPGYDAQGNLTTAELRRVTSSCHLDLLSG